MEPNPPELPVELPVEMTVEEAQEILVQDLHHRNGHQIVDNIYPWWKTFRRPFIIMSVVVMILAGSVISLAITLQTIANDRARESKEVACYNLYTNLSSEATAKVRSSTARVENAGWNALVALSEHGEITPVDTKEITDLIAASEAALEMDEQRLQERAQWIAAGKPLPCPVTTGDLDTGP